MKKRNFEVTEKDFMKIKDPEARQAARDYIAGSKKTMDVIENAFMPEEDPKEEKEDNS